MTEKEFINALKELKKYWVGVGKKENYSTDQVCDGLIHSILVMIDGFSCSNPINLVDAITGEIINSSEELLHDQYYENLETEIETKIPLCDKIKINRLFSQERECGHQCCDFDDREHDLQAIAEVIGIEMVENEDEELCFATDADRERVTNALNYYYSLYGE